MKKTTIALCLCLLAVALFAEEQTTTIRYSFPQPKISEWNGYVQVEMSGLDSIAIAGSPRLPIASARLVVPRGKSVAKIDIVAKSQQIITLASLVRPGSQVHPLSQKPEGPLPLPQPDPAIYFSRQTFPASAPDFFIQNLAGHDIVILHLYPILYLPMQDALVVSNELEITVHWQNGARPTERLRPYRHDYQRVKQFVDNPQDLAIPDNLRARGEYEYIIITNKTLNDSQQPYNFQTLLQARIDRGLTGKIELVENIAANYPGENLGQKIRNYIIDAYQNWGTIYVLLGGDADTKQMSVIPAIGFYAEAEGHTDKTIPADLYYACLDGDFDHNGNGILGEPDDGPNGGEVDLLAEVFVGRAPVDSVEELNNFVQKTLYYENLPATTPYLQQALMLGEYLWTSNISGKIWGGDHMDQLVGSSTAHNIETTGIPATAIFTKLYERDGNFSTTDLRAHIKEGVHYLNHLGHSSNTSNMKLSNSAIPGLDNSQKYFLGYTQGCYAGAFDNKSTWSTISSDAFLEEMVSGPVGAFAYLGNSRYGWGDDHSTKGPSHMYHRQFFHGRFAEGITQLGKLNHYSKERNIALLNNTAMRWCYYQVTLFGDPALELKSPVASK